MSFVFTLAALFLVSFGAYVASLVWRSSFAGLLALAGSLLAAAFWLLAAMLLWVLARPWTPEQPNLLRALHDLTYLMGGPAHVVLLGMFVGASAASLPDSVGLPLWSRWLGFAAAAISLLSVFALLLDPATLLLPIGRGLTMLWIVVVAVSLAWSQWRLGTRAVGRTPAAFASSR